MEYEIKLTEECERLLLSLNEQEQVDVLAIVTLLERLGPQLGNI